MIVETKYTSLLTRLRAMLSKLENDVKEANATLNSVIPMIAEDYETIDSLDGRIYELENCIRELREVIKLHE